MYVPLGTTVVAFAALFANKSSEITGMPGAKAGVSAPQRSPPCLYYIYIPAPHADELPNKNYGRSTVGGQF